MGQGRWGRLCLSALVLAAASSAVVQAAVAHSGAATGKTMKFTALYGAHHRVAHPPAGTAGDETWTALKLVDKTGVIGSGTEYNVTDAVLGSTRFRFRFNFHNGSLTLAGKIEATARGFSEQFSILAGTGAYKGARGSGLLEQRAGSAAGIVITLRFL